MLFKTINALFILQALPRVMTITEVSHYHSNPKELGNKYLCLTQPHAKLAPTQEFHQAVIKYNAVTRAGRTAK